MKKHIPNAITCCNLISGCVAIVLAVVHQYQLAMLVIIAGAVFDFFDGMAARLLHVSSPIGKELDSLADVVTFGVAPSVMLLSFLSDLSFSYMVAAAKGGGSGISGAWVTCLPWLSLLMAAFSALRLAKFNLDERQTMGFIGLPTPANALFWSSLIVGWGGSLVRFPSILPILLVLMLLSCYLQVSEIPMFALKFKTWGWQGNQIRWLFMLSCLPLIVLFRWGAPAIIVAWYLLLSVVTHKSAAANT